MKLSKMTAARIITLILFLLLVFHILIITDALPGNFVWGGQVQEKQPEFIHYEIFAIVVTCIFILISHHTMRLIRADKKSILNKTALWIMLLFFFLNTVGNISSGITLEKLIFTPVTVLLCLLLLRVIIR